VSPRFRCAPRFDPTQLPELGSRYHEADDALIEREIAPRARRAGRLTKPDLEAIRQWKWPPSRGRPSRDAPDFVEAVTEVALSTSDERLRIEVLTLLDGVGWPVASVILHFVHNDRYPILDRLALKALGNEEPASYDFAFWWDYTRCCRRLADEHGVTMRQLDRALWQLAKEAEEPRRGNGAGGYPR
jgi:hypothetical protein